MPQPSPPPPQRNQTNKQLSPSSSPSPFLPPPDLGSTLHSAGGVDLAAFSLSICGDLAQPCVDSLTGIKLNGSAFSYFGDGPGPDPKLKCWDVVTNFFFFCFFLFLFSSSSFFFFYFVPWLGVSLTRAARPVSLQPAVPTPNRTAIRGL